MCGRKRQKVARLLKRVDWIMELLGKILMTTKGSLYVKGKVVAVKRKTLRVVRRMKVILRG